MTTTDYLLIAATLLGPILAVQAQKWVERAREKSQRRENIFKTLMATRQARVSLEHVQALNSIDLAFYLTWSNVMRRRKHQDVLDAWHDYYDHLSLPLEKRAKDEAGGREWLGRGDELFTNLLDKMAKALNYKFDRNDLKAGSYSPEAFGMIEQENQLLRHGILQVLSGNRALPMEVKGWPTNQEAVDRQKKIEEVLTKILYRLVKNTDPQDK